MSRNDDMRMNYNTELHSVLKQHEVVCGMQISKKLTYIISCVLSIPKQGGRNYKNCAREDVYTDKQLRPVLFKATEKQSLPFTPILFKLLQIKLHMK